MTQSWSNRPQNALNKGFSYTYHFWICIGKYDVTDYWVLMYLLYILGMEKLKEWIFHIVIYFEL